MRTLKDHIRDHVKNWSDPSYLEHYEALENPPDKAWLLHECARQVLALIKLYPGEDGGNMKSLLSCESRNNVDQELFSLQVPAAQYRSRLSPFVAFAGGLTAVYLAFADYLVLPDLVLTSSEETALAILGSLLMVSGTRN